MNSVETDDLGYPIVSKESVVKECNLQQPIEGIQGALSEDQLNQATQLLDKWRTARLPLHYFDTQDYISCIYFGDVP